MGNLYDRLKHDLSDLLEALQCKSSRLKPQSLHPLKPCECLAKVSLKSLDPFPHLATLIQPLPPSRYHKHLDARLLRGLLRHKHRNQRKETAKMHPLLLREPLNRDPQHHKDRDEQATHQT